MFKKLSNLLLFMILLSLVLADEVFFYDDFNRPDSDDIGSNWTEYIESISNYTIVNNELIFNGNSGNHKVWLHSRNTSYDLKNLTQIDFKFKLDRNMDGKNFAQMLRIGEFSDTIYQPSQIKIECGMLDTSFIYCWNGSITKVEILNWTSFHENKYYNISIKNIDWDIYSYELYINEKYYVSLFFRYPGLGKQVTLFNKATTPGGPYLGTWDDIVLYKTTAESNIDPLLLKHAPVFYLHNYEAYEPKEIASLMDYSNLTKKSSILIKEAPIEIEDILDLDESKIHYMDMNLVDTRDLNDLPYPENFTNYQTRIYARKVVDEEGFPHLQYFLFYPFQDYQTMNHEGDWELVQVTLKSNNQIHSVSYFFNLFTETYYDLDLIELVNDTHPVVLVAKGSHNTYASDEPYVFHEIFEFPEKMKFWFRFFRAIKKLDKMNKDGLILKPESLPLDTDEIHYEIEEINDSTPWVNYEGRWGQATIRPFNNGPRFPKHSLRFGGNWDYPGTLTNLPGPLTGVMLYSPLDIRLFDENNNTITDTNENIVLLTNSTNEPEGILIKELNITINLIANESGNFTLEAYYYDNNTDTGLLLVYINKSATDTTKATLNPNNNYFLHVDEQGDGIYEIEYPPDEIIGYNDKDYDRIHDMSDNCPSIYNPGQNDFNNDNIGDLCDNPRYYKNLSLQMLEAMEQDKQINLAKQNIEKSLDLEYWESNFSINSRRVFIRELIAVNHLREHNNISKLLAKADALIVEKRLDNIDINNLNKRQIKKYHLATRFYEKGNGLFNKGEYKRAILSYFRAWTFLEINY